MIELKRITAYTVPEVAETLNVGTATVYRYIKSGALRAQKIGGKFYVTDQTLEEYVAGERTRVSVVSDTTEETGER